MKYYFFYLFFLIELQLSVPSYKTIGKISGKVLLGPSIFLLFDLISSYEYNIKIGLSKWLKNPGFYILLSWYILFCLKNEEIEKHITMDHNKSIITIKLAPYYEKKDCNGEEKNPLQYELLEVNKDDLPGIKDINGESIIKLKEVLLSDYRNYKNKDYNQEEEDRFIDNLENIFQVFGVNPFDGGKFSYSLNEYNFLKKIYLEKYLNQNVDKKNNIYLFFKEIYQELKNKSDFENKKNFIIELKQYADNKLEYVVFEHLNNNFIIAKETKTGQFLAFVNYNEESDGSIYINKVVTKREYQGRGIMKEIFKKLKEKNQNISLLSSKAFVPTKSLSFYACQNFYIYQTGINKDSFFCEQDLNNDKLNKIFPHAETQFAKRLAHDLYVYYKE